MDFMYSIVGFFAGGGLFMFPIAVVAAVGAAIAIERYISLTRLGIKNRQRLGADPARCSRAATSTRRAR